MGSASGRERDEERGLAVEGHWSAPQNVPSHLAKLLALAIDMKVGDCSLFLIARRGLRWPNANMLSRRPLPPFPYLPTLMTGPVEY